MLRTTICKCVAVGAVLLTTSLARADFIINATMDTTAFQSLPSGDTVTIGISFIDGSLGDGVSNNSATITNFNVVGGSLDASSTTSYGSVNFASGSDLTGTVVLRDSSFTAITENFSTVGSSLSFQLDLTTNLSPSEQGPAPGGPDAFGFSIFDSDGLINYTSSTGNFLDVSITGPSPTVSANGGNIGTNGLDDISSPSFSSVPEPSTLVLMLSGAIFAGAASARKRFGRRKRCASLERA